jgi:hypothetical protein
MSLDIRLASIVSDTAKDMDTEERKLFRVALAKTLPEAVNRAAEIVRAENKSKTIEETEE